MAMTKAERAAAKAAHPDSNSEVTMPSGALSTRFVIENKIDAILAARGVDIETWDEQVAKRDRSLEELAHLGDRFENEGIDYAVIKSLPPLPKRIGDLDVLVSDLDAAAKTVESAGYTIHSIQPNKRKYEREKNGGSVEIHLHSELSWHGTIYLDANRLLEDTRTRSTGRGEFPVPAAADELLLTAAHMLFEKRNNRIILLDVFTIHELFDRFDIDLEELQERAATFGWEIPFRFYFTAVNDVHEELFGDAVAREVVEDLEAVHWPVAYDPLFAVWLFPLRTMIVVRRTKLAETEYDGLGRSFLSEASTYGLDIVDEIRTRYGITFTSRRVRRAIGGRVDD